MGTLRAAAANFAGNASDGERIDENLIEKVLSGNTDAFAGIVDRYKTRVFTLAYRMLTSREEAEDISQEVFIKVYKSLKTFDTGRTKLSTWIYRITYNLCVDHLRKRRETAPLDEGIPAASSECPEELSISSDSARKLHQAVQQLPEEYRVPLILFHFYELSYQEICTIMDVPMSIVKNRLFRARKILREKLGGGESGDM